MRTIATLAIMALAGFTSPAFAQTTAYVDVPSGAYYEDAAAALLESGALDSSEVRLRPGDLATRAEVMKMLVSVNGTALVYPTVPSFRDVVRSAWYFPYVETSARAGWFLGDDACYGRNPAVCSIRPGDPVNRAEMAIILKRAFHLNRLSLAPTVPDNRTGAWYFDAIQTAADHCILRGDDQTGLFRPDSAMNRAEMVVLFFRAQQQLRYGQDCAQAAGQIKSVSVTSSQRVQVTFNLDTDPNVIGQEQRYSVESVSGQDVSVIDTNVVNSRIVELTLGSSLQAGTTYRVLVNGMRTENGTVFSDDATFVSASVAAQIVTASAQSGSSVRLTFDSDVQSAAALDESLYMLVRSSGGGGITVENATIVSNRIVDLELETNLVAGVAYTLSATNMRTSAGTAFSDSIVFSFPGTTAHITGVSIVTSTMARVTFDTDLDGVRAEQTNRFAVSDGVNSVSILTATLLSDNRTVELRLGSSLRTQTAYTVTVTNLLTAQGVLFNNSFTTVYVSGTSDLLVSLEGSKQIPPVTTAATGTGTFTLSANGLQYDITVRNLSGAITGAHFHTGGSSVNGAVLQSISFSSNRATGSWTLTSEQRNALLRGDIYVNVHTIAHPDGEIRGQIILQ